MISVVIPVLNGARTLTAVLSALVPAAVDGLVREVIVVDGGSNDGSEAIADDAGAIVVKSRPGRGIQLIQGAERAKFPWLLFVHADSVLATGWDRAAARFIDSNSDHKTAKAAAAFRLQFDDEGAAPRILERLVQARNKVFALPYGDQGLLISRALYEEIGGYRDMPIMEDVDIIRRIGRQRLALLPAAITTSAERYRKDGYVRRALHNQTCLVLYKTGLSPERIVRLYDRSRAKSESKRS